MRTEAQVQVTQVSSKLRWQAPLSRTQTQGLAPRLWVWFGNMIFFLSCPKTTVRYNKKEKKVRISETFLGFSVRIPFPEMDVTAHFQQFHLRGWNLPVLMVSFSPQSIFHI
jgi:hypothetical protein